MTTMAQSDAVTTEDLTNMFLPDPSTDFAEQSQLTYMIPSQTNLDLETAFKDLESGKSMLDCIDTRSSLFFGSLAHSHSHSHLLTA